MRLIVLIFCLFLSAPAAAELVTVAGTIRQDPHDRSKWTFVEDARHKPVGFAPTVVAKGTDLILQFSPAFGRVVSFITAPDETMASQLGVSVGSSVDPDAVVIRLSITQSVTGQVWWDNGWHHQVDSLVTGPRDVEAPKFVGSTLLIRADELPGTGLQLSPWTRDGKVVPYVPAVRLAVRNSFSVAFLDGAAFASTPNERMAFTYTKVVSGPVRVDGGGGPTGLALFSGNIWVMGVMER
ncbi:TPA: hypothetical protein ACKP5X_002564 [Stenotrophomonas maltophilia]|uniref:Uncharacterized protein n=1 Tax=Stenotrophomonas forensis TaxID=2871169 RepID=A0ABY7XYP1_9GAMM|nr:MULTISPECIES: hypothetical protein [Stenotrophomonas]WDM62842.1 hypothetical protein K5L94_17270 [Stenotrophomonas sp. DFS-20110405]HEL3815842.1 hypothetical protein [Stenotrophomonas maltophilia]